MPSFADLVISDSVPAAHTYGRASQKNDTFVWFDRAPGVKAGWKTIQSVVRESVPGQNAGHKVTYKVIDPTLAVTAPASGSGIQPNPVAAYHTLAELSFLIPDAATETDAANILAYAKNLLANASVALTVTKRESWY